MPKLTGRAVVDVMTDADWEAVRTIYEAGIATRNATFETAAPTWAEWDAAHLATPRLVARETDPGMTDVVGWAALVPVSGRCVYAGVAEDSVYVAPGHRGQGIGALLLRALLEGADQAGIWTVQAGIFPENRASLDLHGRCGFRVVGTRERIGRLDGAWRDVVLLERRSLVAGGDGQRVAAPPVVAS